MTLFFTLINVNTKTSAMQNRCVSFSVSLAVFSHHCRKLFPKIGHPNSTKIETNWACTLVFIEKFESLVFNIQMKLVSGQNFLVRQVSITYYYIYFLKRCDDVPASNEQAGNVISWRPAQGSKRTKHFKTSMILFRMNSQFWNFRLFLSETQFISDITSKFRI